MHFAQRGGNHLDLRMLGDDLLDHAEEGRGVKFRFGFDFRPGDAEALLQVFLVADNDVDVLEDAIQHFDGLFFAAEDVPQLGAEIEVKGDHGTRGLGGLHAFDDDLRRGRRERSENATAMEPAYTVGKN